LPCLALQAFLYEIFVTIDIYNYMKIADNFTRRNFVKAGLATALAFAAAPKMANAMVSEPTLLKQFKARSLSFYNTHTGENLKAVYWEKGKYIPENLAAINNILRDHRTGDVAEIDHSLLDLIFVVHKELDSNKPFEVISGYRSPKSNQQLYEKSNGVALKSFHMQGKAIDVRLTDRPLKDLRSAAMQMQKGGVGYYTESDFVHIDTGSVRYW
jgi:uncharacterized protein YcbK (DUF882 family)